MNGLKINADKTKFMIVKSVRRQQRGEIILKCSNGTLIERMVSMKYLGIIIDDRLQFKNHCDFIIGKISKKK